MAERFQKKKQKDKCLLEEDTLNYFRRIASVLEQGFPTDEERELFVENTFTELGEEQFTVFQDATSSRVIEDLVGIAHAAGLRSLFIIFAKDWNAVCQDKIASHTLQKIIMALPHVVLERIPSFKLKKSEESEEDTELRAEDDLIRTVLQLTDVIQSSLTDNLTHSYASHILRALIQVLGGHHVDVRLMRSRNVRNINKQEDRGRRESHFADYEIPRCFRKKLVGICKVTFAAEDFAVYLTEPNASPVIQTLLSVLNKVDPELCQKYIHKVVKKSRIKDVTSESDEHIKLPPVIVDNVGSYLVQELVALASQEVYTELVDALFKGRLLAIALHPTANFVVQQLIRRCPDKDTFTAVFEELGGHIEEILAVNHCGVIVSLGDACLKLGLKQSEYLQVLMKAFHCNEPEERNKAVVPLLAAFKTYEMVLEKETVFKDETKIGSINYHGSLVLQNLFKFKHTKLTSSSLVSLEPDELKTVSCDACGSHVIDAFIQSSTVKDKFKDSLLNKLKGRYVDLACSKTGSRIIDTFWKHCNLTQKTLIASDLVKESNKVSDNIFGKYIYRNLALRLFSQRRQDWMEFQGTGQKKRKLFGEIISMTGADADKVKRQKMNKDTGDENEMSALEDDSVLVGDAQAQAETMFQGDKSVFSSSDELNSSPSYRGRDGRGGIQRGHNQRGGTQRGHNQRGGISRSRDRRGGGQPWANKHDWKDRSQDGGRVQRGGFHRGRGGKVDRGHSGFRKGPKQPKTFKQ